MSLLTMAIRFSDNSITSFKIHKTIEFSGFKDVTFFNDEELLKKHLKNNNFPLNKPIVSISEHNDYDNKSAFFAPYDYGMILIDYVDKKLYNYNNYSGFFNFRALNIQMSISQIFNSNGFDIVDSLNPQLINIKDSDYKEIKCNVTNYKNEVIECFNPFEVNYLSADFFNNIYNIYQSYQLKYPIYTYEYNDEKDNKSIYYIKSDSVNNLFENIINRNKHSRIYIEIPNWTIHEGMTDNLNEMFELIKDLFSFTHEEIKAWEEYK